MKKEYEILTDQGKIKVHGSVYGSFGIHKDFKVYVITHLQSGMRMGTFKKRNNAAALINYINDKGFHKEIDSWVQNGRKTKLKCHADIKKACERLVK